MSRGRMEVIEREETAGRKRDVLESREGKARCSEVHR